MLAATFTLTNCAKEMDAPVQEPSSTGIPFEIIANAVDTKTTNDGMSTVWAEGDALNVFHAEAGTETYVDNGEFTYGETENGNFAGTLASELTAEAYDWYASYPYNEKVTTPASTTSGWMAVGSKSNAVQTQTGNNSMAHIAGENYPLYGVAKNVAVGETPEITMNHLTSLIEVNVYNEVGEDIVVSNISFTAPESVVGTYYVDFTGAAPAFVSSGANYVSNTATLNVVDGEAIVSDEEPAKFYLAVKPFTAAAGSTMTVKVTTSDGKYQEYPATYDMDVVFKPGKIKKLNVYVASLEDPAATANVTWDLTKASYVSKSTSKVEWESDFVNLTLVKDNSSTNADNYLGGTNAHTRVYKNQIMTFTPSAGYEIKKIEFTSTSNDYANKLVNATWSNGAPVASGTLVTVTPSNGFTPISVTIGDATRFTAITVYYSYDNSYVPPTLLSISVSGQTTEFRQNEEFAFGGTVTATYSDESTSVVTTAATFSGYDMTETGTQTVTVSYTEGEATATTTYEIEVVAVQTEPESPSVVTVQEFIDAEVSETDWYKLTGEIISIANATYGNFTIKDETGEIYIYGMTNGWVGENDKSFAEIGLKVGDVVTLGTLRGEYNGTAQGGGNDYPAYYISHEARCATPVITCSNNLVTITCGTSGATVYYTINGEVPTASSNVYTEPFEISTTTLVKAYAVCSDMLDSHVSEWECVYVDPNEEQPTTAEATLKFDDTSKRTVGTTSQQVWVENGITFTNNKASSTSNVNTSYSNPIRLYASSSITVDKENMVQIVFDCNTSDYATVLKNSIGTVSGATVTVAADKVTVLFSSPVDTFTVSKLTAQVRMDALTVTYQNN